MAKVLLCAQRPLTDELRDTVIWRDANELRVAPSFEEALAAAVSQRPDLIVVDRDLPRALRLVEDLRREPVTRTISIAVGARGDFSDLELQLLQEHAVDVPTDPRSLT